MVKRDIVDALSKWKDDQPVYGLFTMPDGREIVCDLMFVRTTTEDDKNDDCDPVDCPAPVIVLEDLRIDIDSLRRENGGHDQV